MEALLNACERECIRNPDIAILVVRDDHHLAIRFTGDGSFFELPTDPPGVYILGPFEAPPSLRIACSTSGLSLVV